MGREVKVKATEGASAVGSSGSEVKKRQVPRNGSGLLEWQRAAVVGCLSNDYDVDVNKLQKAFIERKQSIRDGVYRKCLKLAQGARHGGFLRSRCIKISQGKEMPVRFIQRIVQKVNESLEAGRRFSGYEAGSRWKLKSTTLKWNVEINDHRRQSTVNGFDTDKALFDDLDTAGMFEFGYNAARDYLTTVASRTLLTKFDEDYSESKSPFRAFVNVYPEGKVTGVEQHVDHLKYCSVIVGIEESETDGVSCPLVVDGQTVRLGPGMMVIFGRLLHEVPFAIRKNRRITLNMFF
jgi:hypothetical protein